MINIELTEDEKDCLQELMNVAYGSATAAITEIFDAFAKLSIPTIKIINAADLKDYLAKELNFKDEHFIASQQINGPLNGENMFIIDKKQSGNKNNLPPTKYLRKTGRSNKVNFCFSNEHL